MPARPRRAPPRPGPPSCAPAPTRPAPGRPTDPADLPPLGRTTVTSAGRGTRPGRRRRNPEATMSLIAHLTELRNRIAKALLALLVATALSFWWYQHGLGTFIRAPYCNLPADLRYGGSGAPCGLLVTHVFGGVFIPLKVS